MASSKLSLTCRFCGKKNDVVVDLIETRLHEKLVLYFPLKFDATDSFSKSSCSVCANTILQMEGFVLRAKEVEQDFLERASRPPVSNNVMSTADIRSLAHAVASKTKNTRTESVKDVLQKLKASSLVIKKIDKKPVKMVKTEPVEELLPLEEVEPMLKMKMEVLDEEIENLPAEDFVQYDDTDEDDEGRETLVGKCFASVDVKEIHFTEDSNQGSVEDDSLGIENTMPVARKPQVGNKPRQTTAKPGRTRHRMPNSKGVVINLVDPCHYVCVTCKGKFSSFEELQAHIDQSMACKRINSTCEQCGKVFENRRALYQHRQTHNPKPQLICDQCGKVYTNSFNLENHKSQVHGEEIEELGYVYKCCEQTFSTRRELNEHIATHTKILNLLCDTCGKSFTSHKALRSHNMSHLNIRPFSCDLCDKSFRTKLLLVQHSHVHTGVKVFSCDVCDKSFAKKESLKKHYKLHSSEPVTWSSTGEKLISVRPIEQLQQEEYVTLADFQESSLAAL